MLPVFSRPQTVTPHLYRLTVTLKGITSHAYAMSTSVDDAFSRYLLRLKNRHENIDGIMLLDGELAAPTHIIPRSFAPSISEA